MASLTLTDASFDQEVLKSKTPVLVDFWAEWCQPCQMIGPVIEELEKEFDGKIKVGKMNVDENANVPGMFGIMSIPTILLFKEGKPVKTLIGVQSKDTFKKAIQEVTV